MKIEDSQDKNIVLKMNFGIISIFILKFTKGHYRNLFKN
jgi:hypothetical protein